MDDLFTISNQNAGKRTNSLYEKYRPQSWREVIGQEKILVKLSQLSARGLSGRAYWLSGSSGMGKTTIARLIAQEVAAPLYIHEIDAQELTIARINEITDAISYFPMIGDGHCIIVNEAHGLPKNIIRRLLVVLENIPGNTAWIFTTTKAGMKDLLDDKIDAHPLLSRCLEFELEKMNVADKMAARALEIARAEGLDGRPLAQYKKLVQNCRMNFRAVLQAIDAGEMLV